MSDIELVIKIPEHYYENNIKKELPIYLSEDNIVAVLPKGHGNLIQREDAETIFKNARKALLEQSRKEQIKDLQTREMMLLNAEQFIHLIHPIIETDEESEGEK